MAKLLVTGGCGSLGIALVKEALNPVRGFESVIGLSNDEYQVVEAKRLIPEAVWVLCDVRDLTALTDVFKKHEPTHVIHAAALKHVPICEEFPNEAFKTNVLGSRNVLDLCLGIKALAVSTDKAVKAVNVYGTTKFLMEGMFLKAGHKIFRSGNFMGSRGSVIEIWREQAKTGTITMTDPEALRYFIEIDDAAKQCLDHLENGEGVLIPEMLEWSLATLANFYHPECGWDITGLRPGEKMREELR